MFSLIFECPLHPEYDARVRPATRCKACALMFAVRNNANRVLSDGDERDPHDVEAAIIKGVS